MIQCHLDVIAAFGGVRTLARAIGVDPARSHPWAKRGIPAKYWPAVERAAAYHKPPLPVTAAILATLPIRAMAEAAAA